MAARKKKTETPTATIDTRSRTLAYKGFNKGLVCIGGGSPFQYKVGETYEHEGHIELCGRGFHACTSPLDVLNYYSIADGSRYGVVTLIGVNDETRNQDSKRVAQAIKIDKEVTVNDLILAEVALIQETVKGSPNSAEGYSSTAASSGDYSTAASSGDSSKAASSGDYSTAASSGDSSTAASSGDYSTAASSGDSSTAASSGDSSTAASSGNYSTAASSGDSSTAASSGNYSKAASSGDYSTAASSGNYSTAECDTNGFACIAGVNGRAKGNLRSALSLGYRDNQGRNRIAVAYVGENDIEAGVWYKCDNTGTFYKS